ncbi:hypothetical protein ACB092_07G162400 [Castanea dentata]
MNPIHQAKTLPHADKAHLTSNISDPSLPRRRQNTSLKPTLYSTRSTSLQTHLPFLLFSHSTSPPRSCHRDRTQHRRDRRLWKIVAEITLSSSLSQFDRIV